MAPYILETRKYRSAPAKTDLTHFDACHQENIPLTTRHGRNKTDRHNHTRSKTGPYFVSMQRELFNSIYCGGTGFLCGGVGRQEGGDGEQGAHFGTRCTRSSNAHHHTVSVDLYNGPSRRSASWQNLSSQGLHLSPFGF